MGDNFWYQQKSHNGYLVHEVASALQKEIRRGNAPDAMYWASELFLSGLDGYCWKRLEIILVEDIDVLSNPPGFFADIHALRQIALNGRKERKDRSKPDERESLALMAAVTKLSLADKSRVNCNATICYCQMPRKYSVNEGLLDIPDYALDKHTVRGKQLKRGVDHFFDEGAKIEVDGAIINDEPDPYRETARQWENAGKPMDSDFTGELFK